MRRLRSGDQYALNAVLRQHLEYVDQIARRQVIQSQMVDLDPEDVRQAVAQRFLERAASCQFNSPTQVRAYLATCVSNFIRTHATRCYRTRRTSVNPHCLGTLISRTTSAVSQSETVRQIKKLTNNTEWWLICQKAQGASWKAIGEALGVSESAARMRFVRVRRRVVQEMTCSNSDGPGLNK